MIPKYQDVTLDGDNRAKRRVIKALDRQYANTEDVIISGADMSEDASSGFKALEKKLLLFISLTLEAQADIEQEGEVADSGTNTNTFDGDDNDGNNELVVPQNIDPTLSDFDNDSVVADTINPMVIKQRKRRPSQIPRTMVTRNKEDRDENRMRSPAGRQRGRSFSPNPMNIKSPQGYNTRSKILSGGAIYQHSGMFGGILKNMLTVLQDISAILIDISNSFDFLNKEQVFRLMTLLKRAREEVSSLVNTFDNLVSHKFLYNRATKQRMLEEVAEIFAKMYGKLTSMADMYSPAYVRMKASATNEMVGGGYSLGYGMPNRML